MLGREIITFQPRSEESSHPVESDILGGKDERKESPIETLLRECKKELGLLPDMEKVYPLHTFVNDDKMSVLNAFMLYSV